MTTSPAAPFMEQFVIYRPTTKDFPGKWVVRRYVITADNQIVPDAQPLCLAPTLEVARVAIEMERPGLTLIMRLPEDDPVIEEVWL